MELIRAILKFLTTIFGGKKKSSIDWDIAQSLFSRKLTPSQMDGIARVLSAADDQPIEVKAYLLSTVFHETASTMQPITEYGSRSYFNKYEGRADLGNTVQGDGYKYRGRGYVQITGRRNYTKASKLLGVDFVSKPELALDPTYAAKIMILGCTQGWFTGKKLSDYLPGDYINARRVINGLDRAKDIANYALVFEKALRNG